MTKLKVNIPQIEQQENIDDIIKNSEVVYGNEYSKPDPIISFVDGVNENNFMYYSGLSAIFSKQKSGKTIFTTTIMAAAVGNTVIDDKLRGYAHGKNHLWFDTEQQKYFTHGIAYRVTKKLQLKKHPKNLRIFSIKRYKTDDRIRIVEYLIEKTENLGLVVIDGIRDLVHDFNNLHECTDIINHLMNWVDMKKCHILVILHINPLKQGDEEKPRGHLGTELQNKIESSLIVYNCPDDNDIKLIKPRDFREKKIKSFAMKIDKYGMPDLIDYDFEITNLKD